MKEQLPHAESPTVLQSQEKVSNDVEEQHQHADKGPGEERGGEEASSHVEDEHQHAVEYSVLGTSQNTRKGGGVTKMMTNSQKIKQFQLAGTKTTIERENERKTFTGWNMAWRTKRWGRMEAESCHLQN